MMKNLQETIQDKMVYIEELLSKLENKENIPVTSVLEDELRSLRLLCIEHKKFDEDKKVTKKEESGSKMRYYLKDGSIYVIKKNEYRYLYDAKTKVVTYEFENGQIERTFANGIKEIRKKDGSIIIKDGIKDYEYLQ